MEKYERKIKITRELTSIDSDGDGVDDTLALLNKKDQYISFLLKQSIKDLGVYTDYEEKPEVVDLGNFWETSNDGTGDFGTSPISGGVDNPYGSGVDGSETIVIDGDTILTEGCNDPNALNPPPPGVVYDIPCCCQYESVPSPDFGNSGGEVTTSSQAAGCFRLSTGFVAVAPDYAIIDSYILPIAQQWCSGSYSSCGGTYPYIDGTNSNRKPNGCFSSSCPGDTSCPPVNTHHLLTDGECGGNCGQNSTPSSVSYYNGGFLPGCNCNNCEPTEVFSNVRINFIDGPNSEGKYNYDFSFYCVPN